MKLCEAPHTKKLLRPSVASSSVLLHNINRLNTCMSVTELKHR